ncbi:ATP/GTP-binding protein [Marinicella sediminis]|uniref:ATP/GTP-binding protein n=1 Tax=Marinicella sediminis TaxID=1792834 RepID=A0ABV7J7T3_9GAMM|nr:ATP/GTP-binding protein [Marinicella sediminis]
MIHKKIAFIGSVGSGKTTLIKNLSNTETINTDVKSSIDIGKDLTTVGMDYGEIRIDEDLKLGLYGVPGQRKFSFMWDFVKQGLWAVVILIKNNSTESIKELEYLLDYFAIKQDTPCLIGITHSDLIKGETSKKHIKNILNKRNLVLPIYSINANLKENAELIFRTLILLEETNNGT